MNQSEVIIIGAGPAGLALARALHLKGKRATVLERSAEIKNLGGGLTIYPHGFQALESLGLGAQCRHISHEIEDYIIQDGDDLLLKGSLAETKRQAGSSLFSFSRHQLQTELQNSIPASWVLTGQYACAMENLADRATVTLSNGKVLSADLVVVASGANSPLFQQTVLGRPHTKRFCGQAFWGGFISGAGKIPMASKAMLSVLGKGKAAFILTLPGDRQWFYLVSKVESAETLNVENPAKLAGQFFSGWCDIADKILSQPSCFQFGLPVFDIPYEGKWSLGRLIGIGDTVHATGPTAGQGVNCALTDAVALAHYISGEPDLGRALSLFQAWRTPMIEAVIEIEKKSSRAKLISDPAEIAARNLRYRSGDINELMAPVIRLSLQHKSWFEKISRREIAG